MDGPVGELIRAAKRHPMRPAHVHFLVAAPGYEPLVTHVFIDGDKYLHSDVVFGVKDELIAKIERHEEPTMPDGKAATGPWHQLRYDFQLRPGSGHVPVSMASAAE
jgi:protocatechuate 3,4-dioxygenase beta subunit